jgi:hypothetical protein
MGVVPTVSAAVKGVTALASGAGRGLSMRMDHGLQYPSDDFRDPVRLYGIALT